MSVIIPAGEAVHHFQPGDILCWFPDGVVGATQAAYGNTDADGDPAPSHVSVVAIYPAPHLRTGRVVVDIAAHTEGFAVKEVARLLTGLDRRIEVMRFRPGFAFDNEALLAAGLSWSGMSYDWDGITEIAKSLLRHHPVDPVDRNEEPQKVFCSFAVSWLARHFAKRYTSAHIGGGLVEQVGVDLVSQYADRWTTPNDIYKSDLLERAFVIEPVKGA